MLTQETFFAFLASTGGHVSLVLFFFSLIVIFLRKLYGPKGWLRDPRWDELNREQRKQEQTAAMRKRLSQLAPLLEREQAVFENYVASFTQNDPTSPAAAPVETEPDYQDKQDKQYRQDSQTAMYDLKREHSLNVLHNALEIVIAEPALFPPGLPGAGKPIIGRASRQSLLRKGLREPDAVLLLAALYHDLGRFEQLKRYGTFRDAKSLNHARLSAKLLRNERFLAGEKREIRALVRLCVLMHNRYALPDKLAPALRPLCKALRDADKLDILRVMSAELAPGHAPHPTVVLGLVDDPAKYSPVLLEQALKGQNLVYTELRWVNDLRFMLCGWLRNLEFASSKCILARRAYLKNIMAGLPDTEEIRPFTAMIRKDLSLAEK